MDQNCLTLTSGSPDRTDQIARGFADCLAPGDVLLLSGEVGTGKTHFARALIKHVLLEPEDVPSPTYTLVQTYDTRLGDIWHADLYRLIGTAELEELGLTEAFDTAICLIEWPDRLGDLAPNDALRIDFAALPGDECRTISLSWAAPGWAERLNWLR